MRDSELRAAVARLVGAEVRELEPVGGGGNSRVYRVTTARRAYALKRYPGADAAERYRREFGGLQFLWQAGERRIAEPVALDPERALAVYGWLEGDPIAAPEPGDVDALVAFARALHACRRRPEAPRLPLAREAVLSQAELSAQIGRRIAALEAAAVEQPEMPVLLGEVRLLTAQLARAAGAEVPLPSAYRTLSPSDFGFHNALRTASGIAFLDFEYFGWDDPVKLVADVLWHPGMNLKAAARQKFFCQAADIYGVDPEFGHRFERDAPLYGLRWALIVLNEFLPAAWARRVAAGRTGDRRAILATQFAKAIGIVKRVGGTGLPL